MIDTKLIEKMLSHIPAAVLSNDQSYDDEFDAFISRISNEELRSKRNYLARTRKKVINVIGIPFRVNRSVAFKKYDQEFRKRLAENIFIPHKDTVTYRRTLPKGFKSTSDEDKFFKE